MDKIKDNRYPLLLVHIWEYRGYPGHKSTLTRLAQDPVSAFFLFSTNVARLCLPLFNFKVHDQFLKDLRPLLISRENNIMLEFSFWKTAQPHTTNGIYELRKYNLKVRHP
jgi:hypothetical protein